MKICMSIKEITGLIAVTCLLIIISFFYFGVFHLEIKPIQKCTPIFGEVTSVYYQPNGFGSSEKWTGLAKVNDEKIGYVSRKPVEVGSLIEVDCVYNESLYD